MTCPALALCLLTGLAVTDGDTFDHQGQSYRLWGIDAPEAHTAAGEAATRSLDELIADGLHCSRQQQRESYDRIVVRCWTPEAEDVACLQVSRGHADDWSKFSGGLYRRCEG